MLDLYRIAKQIGLVLCDDGAWRLPKDAVKQICTDEEIESYRGRFPSCSDEDGFYRRIWFVRRMIKN